MAMFVFIFLLICFAPVLKQCMNQHSCRCDYSPDLIDDNSVTPLYDFDNPIYHAKEEGEEDCDLLELARLLRQEEKVIQPLEGDARLLLQALLRSGKNENWSRFRGKSRAEW